jgi:hypothetical protein
MVVIRKEEAEHVIRLVNVICARLVTANEGKPLIMICILLMPLRRKQVWRERIIVCNK